MKKIKGGTFIRGLTSYRTTSTENELLFRFQSIAVTKLNFSRCQAQQNPTALMCEVTQRLAVINWFNTPYH